MPRITTTPDPADVREVAMSTGVTQDALSIHLRNRADPVTGMHVTFTRGELVAFLHAMDDCSVSFEVVDVPGSRDVSRVSRPVLVGG